MSPKVRWLLVPLVLAGVVGCGALAVPPPEHAAGRSGSIGLSLTTVPTIRSVTISPGRASFTDCRGGNRRLNTPSAAGKLGFPNGECFVGSIVSDFYPITVTNTGIASNIDISASSAVPADGGSSWSLCSGGKDAVVECKGREHAPGPDQYEVLNFSSFGTRHGGITGTPQCDHVFGLSGTCWATEGTATTEGIELIGPTWSSDTSTKWTITITWTPVPGRQG